MMSKASPTPSIVAPAPDDNPLTVIVMGVSGCGKSTAAVHIAQGIGAHCKDGDELHPQSNIDKMAAGIPLTDTDRQPWLEDVARYAQVQAMKHGVCVIACSALKQQYRQTLNTAGRVVYIFLQGSFELIADRMHQRTGHFMPEALLESQFAALDDPSDEPCVLTVSIDTTPELIASDAIKQLKQHHYLQ